MRIFISYAHADRYMVGQLVEILRNAGLDAWFDHRLVVGKDWKVQLYEAIASSDAFLYAMSPQSIASEWCQWEFAEAIKLQKPIIPVLIDTKTQLPPELSKYQYADFTSGPTPEGTARLMGGLWSARVIIPQNQAPHILENPTGMPAQVESYTLPIPTDTAKAENFIVNNLLQELYSRLMGSEGNGSLSYYQFGCVFSFGWFNSNIKTLVLFILNNEMNLSSQTLDQLLLYGWLQNSLRYSKDREKTIRDGEYVYKYWHIKKSPKPKIIDEMILNIMKANETIGKRLSGNNVKRKNSLPIISEIGYALDATIARDIGIG